MPSSTSSSEARAALAVAVLAPLLTLAAAAFAFTRRPERAPAGQVLAMEELLAEARPEVVVLSDSLGGDGILPERLGEALTGRPTGAVQLWAAGTGPALWYALLKHRVFANGHRPKLVVVASDLASTLRVEPRSAWEDRALHDHTGGGDAVIAAKRYGERGRSELLRNVEAHRLALQDGLLDAVKARAVGLALEGGSAERGRRALAAATEAVFGAEGAADRELLEAVVEDRSARDARREVVDRPVETSFVPDLIELARAHGSKLAFVTMPQSSTVDATGQVARRRALELVEHLNAHGVGFFDLAALDLDDALFRDAWHLGAAGAERFTAELARALADAGALAPGAFEPAPLPARFFAPPDAERTGTAPPLPQAPAVRTASRAGCRIALPGHAHLSDHALTTLGVGRRTPVVVLEEGRALRPFAERADVEDRFAGASQFARDAVRCSPSRAGVDPSSLRAALAPDLPLATPAGEAWWIYPGTAVTLRFAPGWREVGDDAELAFRLLPVVPSDAAPEPEASGLRASSAGRELALRAVDGRLLEGALALGAGAGPLELVLASPPDGAFALLLHVEASFGGRAVDVIGTRADLDPPEVDLLAGHRDAAPAFERVDGEPLAFADRPLEPLPLPPRAASPDLRLAALVAPELAHLADDALLAALEVEAASPLRPREDGRPLYRQRYRLPEGVEPERSRFLHWGELVIVGTLDGTDPLENGRRYTLNLDASRRCAPARGWWVHPGDRARFELPPHRLERLRADADRLALEAHAFTAAGAAPGRLVLALEVDGAAVLERELDAAACTGAALALALDAPVTRAAADVALVVECGSNGTSFLLLRAVLEASGD